MRFFSVYYVGNANFAPELTFWVPEMSGMGYIQMDEIF